MKHIMKTLKTLLKISVLATFAATFTSCEPPVVTPPAETPTNVELSGELNTQTLDATKKYLIKGIVTVPDGAILSIPAGTVLVGQKSSKGTLVIKPGGKLIAEGTPEKPIVFTSNQLPG